ncbi:MAG: hypothetical protein PHS88_03515, partial [Candidatus Omnitrophica bacterium]|nr:hypothetical protein [Candidatus Omnitrophota bacterium]
QNLRIGLRDTIRAVVAMGRALGKAMTAAEQGLVTVSVEPMSANALTMLSHPQLLAECMQSDLQPKNLLNATAEAILTQIKDPGGSLVMDTALVSGLEGDDLKKFQTFVANRVGEGVRMVFPYNREVPGDETFARGMLKIYRQAAMISYSSRPGDKFGRTQYYSVVPKVDADSALMMCHIETPVDSGHDPKIVGHAVLTKPELIRELLRTVGMAGTVRLTWVALLQGYVNKVDGKSLNEFSVESANQAVRYLNLLAEQNAAKIIKAAA